MGGYVLPFGQMSFWGATVITNLLSPFPSLLEWVCGGHYVYNPSLKRFFSFHFLQTHFGISSLSHPDNASEVCGLLTPLHIVPEWYFLCQYAMLKAVPNKNAGFIILLTSIFTFFFFGEFRNLTTLCLLFFNGFSLSSFFSLDRCSIPSREVSILWSYLDITLLFSSYVYLIIFFYLLFLDGEDINNISFSSSRTLTAH